MSGYGWGGRCETGVAVQKRNCPWQSASASGRIETRAYLAVSSVLRTPIIGPPTSSAHVLWFGAEWRMLAWPGSFCHAWEQGVMLMLMVRHDSCGDDRPVHLIPLVSASSSVSDHVEGYVKTLPIPLAATGAHAATECRAASGSIPPTPLVTWRLVHPPRQTSTDTSVCAGQ